MNREQEIQAIEDSVARHSQYKKTLKLLHRYWGGLSSLGGEIDPRHDDITSLIIQRYKDVPYYHINIWFDPKRGYILHGKYRDVVVEQITGDPYLDMMTLHRAIERL